MDTLETMQLFVFGLYLAVLLVIFVYIAIVVLHIGEFRQYSRYLSIVLRLYLVAVILIAIFGAYKIITGKYVAPKKSPQNQTQQNNF